MLIIPTNTIYLGQIMNERNYTEDHTKEIIL